MRVLRFIAASLLAVSSAPGSALVITSDSLSILGDGNTGSSVVPIDFAQIGGDGSSISRAVAEFDISVFDEDTKVTLSFVVDEANGCCGQATFDGFFGLVQYEGDNLLEVADYQATSLGTIANLPISGATTSAGDRFELDVTQSFNFAVQQGHEAFGVILFHTPESTASQSWGFSNFALELEEANIAVPGPGSLGLLGLALCLLGFSRRKFA
ncbi:hypothetical protein B5C34_07500 [Pacificimonas flava]|uniref:PEP-CTERM protein-sorting domain-containing protein n=2 Tax=Pacificimonas TaxID=1960290 RepID=A0A219B5C9_9SPHN|nr:MULTISPECIES: hypothetical protein [Pacificimonas]MBZ6379495.1 hypothetical protein [Pacificimonas aurantium]OWV33316.1 hypothetical protein B5C34_07500 [Pacificimonas flava]